jgi:ribosomal protein S6
MNKMNKYELMVLFKIDSSKEGQGIDKDSGKYTGKKLNESVKEKLAENGGKIIKEDDWGVKDLAYMMDKQTQAHYVIYVFEMESDKIEVFNTWIKRSEFVMRSLITKLE